MENNDILQKLNRIETLIVGSSKQIFTIDDLVNYTGFSKSYLYKLVGKNVISYYKPNNRTLFFTKKEVDDFYTNILVKNNIECLYEKSPHGDDSYYAVFFEDRVGLGVVVQVTIVEREGTVHISNLMLKSVFDASKRKKPAPAVA